MPYLDLQFQLRWSPSPPTNCTNPVNDASSVESAMLIGALQAARNFIATIPIGDSTWHNCQTSYQVAEPSPPPYAFYGHLETPQLEQGIEVSTYGSSYRGVTPSSSPRTAQKHSPIDIRFPPAIRQCPGNLNAHNTEGLHGREPHHNGGYDCGDDIHDVEDMSDEDGIGQLCRFGRPCGVVLTDITEEGLNQHLSQYHWKDLQSGGEQ